jgi:hypothetical protein
VKLAQTHLKINKELEKNKGNKCVGSESVLKENEFTD